MKYWSFIITLLLFFTLFIPTRLMAQQDIDQPNLNTGSDIPAEIANEDDAEIVSNPFTIDLDIGTQSPWTKKVPVTVRFTPNVESTRTEVAWDLPLGLKVEKDYEDFFSADQGKEYVVEASLIPEQMGTYNVVVNITNWGFGSNVTSSEKVTISFDDSLIVTPRSAAYTSANTIRLLIVSGLSIGVIVAAVLALLRGSKKLQKWLKPPQ